MQILYNVKTDLLYLPPAPLAQVTLCNPDTGVAWSDVPMLLDSGADVITSMKVTYE